MTTREEVKSKLEELGLVGEKFKVKDVKKALADFNPDLGPLSLGKTSLEQGVYPSAILFINDVEGSPEYKIAADFDIINLEVWFFEDLYGKVKSQISAEGNRVYLDQKTTGKRYLISQIYRSKDSHYYMVARVVQA